MMCCHLTKEDADCVSIIDDKFASCQSMFKSSAPRKSIWVIGVLSLVGAVFVLVWRYYFSEKNVVQVIMLVHLAVGDGLMGIYLLTLGVKDLLWSGEYYLHDFQWRSSLSCQITGAISVLSSEVSAMLLMLISADRVKNIVFPYRGRALTRQKAHILCTIVWVVGFVIAFLPICGISYFYDPNGRPVYYGRSEVCLPLQLSTKLSPGWEFSVAIFVGMNFLLIIFMIVAYVMIFLKTYLSSRRLARQGTEREVQARARSSGAKREMALAKRVFFIILSDCACWMPIIVVGIRSLLEKNFHPPADLSVWIAVFALPINSALNPLIYTLSTPQVQDIIRPRLQRLINFLGCSRLFSCRQNQQDPQDEERGNPEMVEMDVLNVQGPEQVEGQEEEIQPVPEEEGDKQEERGELKTILVVVAEVHHRDAEGPRNEGQAGTDEQPVSPSKDAVGEGAVGHDVKSDLDKLQAAADGESPPVSRDAIGEGAVECDIKNDGGGLQTAANEDCSSRSEDAVGYDKVSDEGELQTAVDEGCAARFKGETGYYKKSDGEELQIAANEECSADDMATYEDGAVEQETKL